MNRRIGIIVLCGVALVLGVGLIFAARSGGEATREEVKQAMSPLIDGVDRFRAQNGRLPNSLNELVPTILPRIPEVPRGGKSWEYANWGMNREHYSITLRLNRETIDYRTDLPGGWFYRDSSF